MSHSQTATEANLDGIVGPTHHYGGLALGNIASQRHRHQLSNPREAALQGLAKMRRLADLGLTQAVLPPHPRPDPEALRALGFTGSDADVLNKARHEAPDLLAACASASAMWAANAGTVSPGADSADGRLHLTPANLISQYHRSLEPPVTTAIFRAIFPDADRFAVHPPLPAALRFADEGAANHTRLGPAEDRPGLQLFVFGRAEGDAPEHRPRRYPARQALDASRAIARLHQLPDDRAIFIRQNPAAIDEGVFHNDVIAVGHRNLLLYHERAFAEAAAVDLIRDAYRKACDDELLTVRVTEDDLPVRTAVDTYLFNSQILTPPGGRMMLLCPTECRDDASARQVIERIIADDANPIASVEYVDVRQSMHNGGGPACLRLRVPLTPGDRAAAHPGIFLSDALDDLLRRWVRRHYRDELRFDDLADPRLLDETRTALDELTRILRLGPIYPFQRSGATP